MDINQKILIIGGQTLYREAICLLLSRIFLHAEVFEAPNSEDCSDKNINEVDLILLCMTPPYLTTLLALPKLRRRFSTSKILILSDVIDSRIVQMARIRGAHCFVHSAENSDYLVAAMLDTLAGKLIFPEIPEGDGKQIRWSWQMNFKLTGRQAEVFDLLCKGMTNKEIGAKLRMTDNTVRTHVSALLKILEVRNRTEAVILGRSLL